MGADVSVHEGVMNSELPFQTARVVLSPGGQPLLGVPATLAGVSVFVAEDEPMLVWALEEVLSDFGCRVVGTAARVAEALAFVADHAFDVAILDGKLADGSVDPVLDVLIARGTPFIIASGVASTDLTTKYAGAVVLQKPYKDADLRQALRLALARELVEPKSIT